MSVRHDPLGDEGVFAVGVLFTRELKWIFRPQPTADVGIDGHAEVCRDGKPVGKLFALQVKSGPSYLRERSADAYVYRGSLEHLDYWINFPLPVLLVIYDPATKNAYWQALSAKTVRRTAKGWKTEVPECNILGAAAIDQLLSLLGDDDIRGLAEADIELPAAPAVESASYTEARVLTPDDLLAVRTEFVANVTIRLERLIDRLMGGNMSLDDWEAEMVQIIKLTCISQFALAMGGFKQTTLHDYGRIKGLLFQQLKALNMFALDLAHGRYALSDSDVVVRRAALFVECSHLAYEMGAAVAVGDVLYSHSDNSWSVKIPGKLPS